MQFLAYLFKGFILWLLTQLQSVAEKELKEIAQQFLYSLGELVEFLSIYIVVVAVFNIFIQLAIDKKVEKLGAAHVTTLFVYFSDYFSLDY